MTATPTLSARKLTDAAADAAIYAASRDLQLPTVRRIAGDLADECVRAKVSHRGYLAELLATEVDDRSERRRKRRIHEARFPRLKTIDDFDFDQSPVDAATIATLTQGAWIDAAEPLVLLGDSGTGKTHLLIALGIEACRQGRRVRYATFAQLANELAGAQADRNLARTVDRWGRYDLVCLDELGYVRLDTVGAELCFQILTEREEAGSVAAATNLPFSEWGVVFCDPRLAAAVVDRLTYKAHIIETGTDSYRLKASQTRQKGTTPKPIGTNTEHASTRPAAH